MGWTRRDLLRDGVPAAAGTLAAAEVAPGPDLVRVDPRPLFPISPWLHMQFMEPLGLTDSSVEASWDWDADAWRRDFVAATADLAPDVIRYGGLFSRYYKWREGVGPPARRPPMRNYVWGGWERNRVGTAELASLCRQVGAQLLPCVNFLGDGRRYYASTPEGDRTGDAAEAADWVAYCNDPDNAERRRDGTPEPYDVKLWQIGNETSYGDDGFTRDEAVAHTIEFARAMRARDPSITLIAWGDRGRSDDPSLWAGAMAERAGDLVDLDRHPHDAAAPAPPGTVLNSLAYQREPERAWEELLELAKGTEARLVELEQALDAVGSKHPIAVTEGHLSLAPRNLNPILTEWLTGVFHARAMNTYQRHGNRVRIATVADFNGTRWTTMALRLEMPRGASYLMPAGAVMRLFKRHNGRDAVAVPAAPPDLDIAASRTGDRLFLHVANLAYARPTAATLAVDGRRITAGRVLEIAPTDLRLAANEARPDAFTPTEKPLPVTPAGTAIWRFPPASVSAVELDTA